MAGSTPIYGFPYPESSDLVANYPALGQDLAEDIESTIAGIPKSFVRTASVSLSGSNIYLNSCFSSAYSTYKIIIALSAATASTLRLSVGGVANTANSYIQRGYYGGFASGNLDQLSTNWGIYSSTDLSFVTLDLHNVAVASPTFGIFGKNGGNLYGEFYAISHSASTAFDGFQIVGTSITGRAYVYGLEQ